MTEFDTQIREAIDLIERATASIPPPPPQGSGGDEGKGSLLTNYVERVVPDADAAATERYRDCVNALAALERTKVSSAWHAALVRKLEKSPKEVAGWIDHNLEQLTRKIETLRRERTKERLNRSRAFLQDLERTATGSRVVYKPQQQPSFTDGTDRNEPAPIEHHDILMIAPKGVHDRLNHYRFPVRKALDAPGHGGGREPGGAMPAGPDLVGSYTRQPELMDIYDIGQRKSNAIAHPEDWGHAEFRATRRGPAVATIPVKPEPGASSCITCYLVNAQNLNYRNAWTAEEWNDIPDGPDLPPAKNVDVDAVEMLVAGPRGLVFHIDLRNLRRWEPGRNARLVVDGIAEPDVANATESPFDGGSVTCVDLAPQTEVWQQLRGGCVMGRALYDDGGERRVVPLVNITTLTPE